MSYRKPTKLVSFRLEEDTIQKLDEFAGKRPWLNRTFILSLVLRAIFHDLTDDEVLHLILSWHQRAKCSIKLALIPDIVKEDEKEGQIPV